VAAGQLCRPNDSFSTLTGLAAHARKILADLNAFKDSFEHSLPPSAVRAILDCVSTDANISVAKLLAEDNTINELRNERTWSALIRLAAVETEVTFILSDVQAEIRARSERAFSHLQRLIVVDTATRDQWKAALDTGEVACEKLGAVHLLWHGIWAFKVSAVGERTDLVYQEPMDRRTEEQPFADGLVLTEWKVAKSGDEASQKFREARDQAKRYAKGVLAGNELRAFRYIVVVSLDRVRVPSDIEEQAIVYRHTNIAVCPTPPSQHGRRELRKR
jgi:hypothetical protein